MSEDKEKISHSGKHGVTHVTKGDVREELATDMALCPELPTGQKHQQISTSVGNSSTEKSRIIDVVEKTMEGLAKCKGKRNENCDPDSVS